MFPQNEQFGIRTAIYFVLWQNGSLSGRAHHSVNARKTEFIPKELASSWAGLRHALSARRV
jgi:hypothetical protein